MQAQQSVTTNPAGAATAAASNAPRFVLRPAVDICEDANGITLYADMPGVSRERLNLRVDGRTLAIEGDAEIRLPAEMRAVHAEVRSTRYERSFTLSSELATDRIEASLKDGVLTLRVPKRAELQPRRIEVRAG
jgi:HSP20 family protein